MKPFSLLIFLLCSLYVIGQETEKDLDKKIYIYKTFEDYEGNNYKYIGDFDSFDWRANKLYVKNGDDKNKISINKFWGFSINDRLFRFKKNSPKIPVMLVKSKNIYVYVNGNIHLSYLENFSMSATSTSSNNVFYSDKLNNKIYKIEKLITKHKDNRAIDTFRKCIKKGTKRYGYQSKFNSYKKCIDNY